MRRYIPTEFPEISSCDISPKDMSERHLSYIGKIWRFYYDGFRAMTVGRWLWTIIILKLIVLFLVLKIFFFPDLLQRDYSDDKERAQAVRTALSDKSR